MKTFIFANEIEKRMEFLNAVSEESKITIVGISDEYDLAVISIVKLEPEALVFYGNGDTGMELNFLRDIRERIPEISIILISDSTDFQTDELLRDNTINFCSGSENIGDAINYIKERN